MNEPPNELFTRLFAESAESLRRYVRRLVRSRDTADEIVQEAFLRTYERGETVRKPRAFLYSTARNLASDQRRHDRMAATDLVADIEEMALPGGGQAPDDLCIAGEASQLLKEAVDRLPPQCRAAFSLRVLFGYSYAEIGIRLGLSPKTIEKHIAHGLKSTHDFLRARYWQYDPSTLRRAATVVDAKPRIGQSKDSR